MNIIKKNGVTEFIHEPWDEFYQCFREYFLYLISEVKSCITMKYEWFEYNNNNKLCLKSSKFNHRFR